MISFLEDKMNHTFFPRKKFCGSTTEVDEALLKNSVNEMENNLQ